MAEPRTEENAISGIYEQEIRIIAATKGLKTWIWDIRHNYRLGGEIQKLKEKTEEKKTFRIITLVKLSGIYYNLLYAVIQICDHLTNMKIEYSLSEMKKAENLPENTAKFKFSFFPTQSEIVSVDSSGLIYKETSVYPHEEISSKTKEFILKQSKKILKKHPPLKEKANQDAKRLFHKNISDITSESKEIMREDLINVLKEQVLFFKKMLKTREIEIKEKELDFKKEVKSKEEELDRLRKEYFDFLKETIVSKKEPANEELRKK